MAIKALYYFLVFFFVVIVILLTQEPYKIELMSDSDSSPLVEFINVQNYDINENGIEMFAKADNAKRFSDKDVLYNVYAYMQKNSTLETLRSNNATLKDKVIYLDGDVVYTRDNTTTLRTEQVEYSQKDDTLIGKVPFELKDTKSISRGESFIYYTKTGKLEAKNIKAVIKMERE